MASDDMPGAAFTRTVRGFFGEELTIIAYAPVDAEDGGAVEFVIKGEGGETVSAHISSPAEREALARAWMESRRIADGEAAASDPRGGQPPAPPAYDPDADNCAGMPGCGNQRVLFTWFHMPAICCPRCYENLFGAAPEPGSVITLRAAPSAPVHLPSGGERVESAVHRLLGLPEGF